MEENLADKLVSAYKGNLIYPEGNLEGAEVEVVRLNDLLVKVRFDFRGVEVMFRSMLSDQKEGVMMLIQKRTAEQYILTGIGGAVPHKPNVHGGLILETGALFFHISVTFFDYRQMEFYFRGYPEHGSDEKKKNIKPEGVWSLL